MRRTLRAGMTAFAVLLGAVSCRDATGPVPISAVVVVPDSVIATTMTAGSVKWMQFAMEVSVTNSSSTPLRLFYCSNSVEQNVSGVWKSASGPTCSLQAAPEGEILPGATRVMTVTVAAALSGPGGPDWTGEGVRGEHRLRVALVPPGYSGVIPTIPSNSFALLLHE